MTETLRGLRGIRRLAPISAAFVVVLGAASIPSATAGGGANHAVLAHATADASTMSRSGIQVTPAGGPTVDSDNLAQATATDCTGCRAVAVAFQAVVATGNPSTVTPTNAGVAANVNCTSCFSFAFAYQYVLTTEGPATLSPEGHSRIETLRVRVAETAASGLPADELSARLEQLADEFKTVIDEELRDAGHAPSGAVSKRIGVDIEP